MASIDCTGVVGFLKWARVAAPCGHVDELAQPERGLELVAAFTLQDHAERGRATSPKASPAHGRAGRRGARNRPSRAPAPARSRPPRRCPRALGRGAW